MDKLLTVEEIAEYLNLKPSTIYQWTHQGFIPHIKIGNRVRFRMSQIEKWLERKTVNGRARKRVEIISAQANPATPRLNIRKAPSRKPSAP